MPGRDAVYLVHVSPPNELKPSPVLGGGFRLGGGAGRLCSLDNFQDFGLRPAG